MPLIQVRVLRDEFDAAQKAQIIRDVTDAMVRSTGEAGRAATWVLVEEVEDGAWGIAGTPLRLADLAAPEGE